MADIASSSQLHMADVLADIERRIREKEARCAVLEEQGEQGHELLQANKQLSLLMEERLLEKQKQGELPDSPSASSLAIHAWSARPVRGTSHELS